MSLKDQIKHSASDAVERLRVRSALNPILWLCLIVTVPGLSTTPFFKNPVPEWYIAIILTPVALAAFGFLFLLFFDRDKLQSEDYQLRKRSLELIEQKGQQFPVKPTSIDVIANPDYPQQLE